MWDDMRQKQENTTFKCDFNVVFAWLFLLNIRIHEVYPHFICFSFAVWISQGVWVEGEDDTRREVTDFIGNNHWSRSSQSHCSLKLNKTKQTKDQLSFLWNLSRRRSSQDWLQMLLSSDFGSVSCQSCLQWLPKFCSNVLRPDEQETQHL